jgi:hypothetical protein
LTSTEVAQNYNNTKARYGYWKNKC